METVLLMIIKKLEAGDVKSAKKYAEKFIAEIDNKELDKGAVKELLKCWIDKNTPLAVLD